MARYYQEPEDNNEKDNDFVKAYIRRMLGNDVADYHAGQWDDETEEYYLDGKRVAYGRPDWSVERNKALTSSLVENALGKPTRSLDDYRWDDNRRTFYKTNEYEMFKDKNTMPFNKTGKPLEFGNVNLNNRPVLNNSDGTISTVNSISFNDGKNEVLIPTIGVDRRGNPYQMSDDEAIDNYYRTGQHLGKFKSPEDASRFAEILHRDQEKKYRR